MASLLPQDYTLRQGSTLDRAMLLKFLQQSYHEMFGCRNYGHLVHTVDQYLSRETPLWWLVHQPSAATAVTVGGLWAGAAIDQVVGDRHTHIFLLYVAPTHRRQGLGRSLMETVEAWARARGDRQIGLQVFLSNQPALKLYESLGFEAQSVWMSKVLE